MTYSQEELAPLSPLSFNSIKLVGLSEACKEPKDINKEKKSEPNFPNKVNTVTCLLKGTSQIITKSNYIAPDYCALTSFRKSCFCLALYTEEVN